MYNGKQENFPPGFPRRGKFKTKEEVDAYFSSEKIQCLLCGKWFKSIGGNHMIHKLGITTDEYKEMFGLPWKRGLTGKRVYKRAFWNSRKSTDKPFSASPIICKSRPASFHPSYFGNFDVLEEREWLTRRSRKNWALRNTPWQS